MEDLIVITSQVGDEYTDTGRDVEAHILPLMRAHGIRYVQVARHGHFEADGITVLDDSRVELIDGYLVRKMPKKPPHIWAVRRIVEAMPSLLPPGWTWWKEDPVKIPDFDEPEPDVTVLRGSAEDYRNRIPDASDVVLLVEVAERTLARDRGEKLTAYAKGGIAVY